MKIWNKRTESPPPDAIYVGRPSIWGNPFLLRSEQDRNYVCDRFEEFALEFLRRNPQWLEPLVGKDLVCFCSPKRCHAETLMRLANSSTNG